MNAAERRQAATERMRESRERRRAGYLGIYSVPLHKHDVAAFVRHGLLAESDIEDPEAIGNALGAALDRLQGSQPDKQ